MRCLPILFYQYSIRAHARVHVYMLYLFVKSVSCFIFMFQLIENQTFQELKHWCSMFHLLKVLIINVLCYENETWNKKTSQGKYYVRARKATRPHLGATRPRVGICLSRLDALTSKYNTFSYCQVGASNPNLAMPTRGRVAPR